MKIPAFESYRNIFDGEPSGRAPEIWLQAPCKHRTAEAEPLALSLRVSVYGLEIGTDLRRRK